MNSQTFVEGFLAAQGVIAAQLQGINHEESLVQPSKEGNCLNWIAGHLLATRGHALALLGEQPFLTDEEAQLYRMGSKPILPGAPHVKLERLVEGLNKTGETLIAKLRDTPGEELSRRMCCNFQKAASERLVGSIRLRLMHPPRTAC